MAAKKAGPSKSNRKPACYRYEVLYCPGRGKDGFWLPARRAGYYVAASPADAIAKARQAGTVPVECSANAYLV